MKFCKDCRWFEKKSVVSGSSYIMSYVCNHEKNTGVDPVNGITFRRKSPYSLRDEELLATGKECVVCGHNAAWFEPKEGT